MSPLCHVKLQAIRQHRVKCFVAIFWLQTPITITSGLVSSSNSTHLIHTVDKNGWNHQFHSTTSFAQLKTNKVLLIEWARGTTNPGFGFYDHKISETFPLIYTTTDIICIFLNAHWHWSDSYKAWEEMIRSYLTWRLQEKNIIILIFCIHEKKPTCTLLSSYFV